jgi:hypothetical protein
MVDLYATPESDVVQRTASERGDGSVEGAIDSKSTLLCLKR